MQPAVIPFGRRVGAAAAGTPAGDVGVETAIDQQFLADDRGPDGAGIAGPAAAHGREEGRFVGKEVAGEGIAVVAKIGIEQRGGGDSPLPQRPQVQADASAQRIGAHQ